MYDRVLKTRDNWKYEIIDMLFDLIIMLARTATYVWSIHCLLSAFQVSAEKNSTGESGRIRTHDFLLIVVYFVYWYF